MPSLMSRRRSFHDAATISPLRRHLDTFDKMSPPACVTSRAGAYANGRIQRVLMIARLHLMLLPPFRYRHAAAFATA